MNKQRVFVIALVASALSLTLVHGQGGGRGDTPTFHLGENKAEFEAECADGCTEEEIDEADDEDEQELHEMQEPLINIGISIDVTDTIDAFVPG